MPFITRKNTALALLAAATLHLTGGALLAGDLNPPAGPVAKTMKTLDEVEPRTPISQVDIPFQILQDGSYYLTESVRVANPGDAFVIRVGVDNVTLDLRGFTIFGATGGAQADDGILIKQGVQNVTIHDGDIVTCADAGIEAVETTDVRVMRVTSSGHGGDGFRLGTSSQLIDCVAHTNGGDGFETSDACILRRCTARSNFGNGMLLGSSSVVSESSATDNTGLGVAAGLYSSILNSTASVNRNGGFYCPGGTVVGCTAQNNNGYGFGGSGSFSSCTSAGNDGSGFDLSGGSAVENSTASFNNIGFELAEGSTATNCRASSSDTYGFNTEAATTLESCAAYDNKVGGFNTIRTRISNCTATNNDGNGFTIVGSYISGSYAVSNDAHGIEASNTSTIDGNQCYQNGFPGGGYGLRLTGSFNAVFRNICNNNSSGNYDVAVIGNKVGTVTNNPAAAGPWDNITFP